jgi:hypothetical protein
MRPFCALHFSVRLCSIDNGRLWVLFDRLSLYRRHRLVSWLRGDAGRVCSGM